MSANQPTFYPPRARGWGRLRAWHYAVRRIFLRQELWPSPDFGAILAGFFLPGLALRLAGRSRLAWCCFGLYLLLGLVFLAYLGYLTASFALAAMVALHAFCVHLAFRHGAATAEPEHKVRNAIMLLILCLAFYGAAQSLLGRAIIPIRFGERVVVANCLASPRKATTGDWIVFHVTELRSGNVLVQEGLGFGTVCAVAGDKVEFGPQNLWVNGKAYPRQPYMPEEGSLVVPEKHCMAWPDLAISGRIPASDARIRQLLAQAGVVSHEDVVGTIFRHWFWRKQI